MKMTVHLLAYSPEQPFEVFFLLQFTKSRIDFHTFVLSCCERSAARLHAVSKCWKYFFFSGLFSSHNQEKNKWRTRWLSKQWGHRRRNQRPWRVIRFFCVPEEWSWELNWMRANMVTEHWTIQIINHVFLHTLLRINTQSLLLNLREGGKGWRSICCVCSDMHPLLLI